jgi:CRISPR-associated endonuclease Cas1
MTWRIVAISKNCKLDLKLNYLVIRDKDLQRIHLSEIAVLIVENTAVSITAALLCELSKRKVKIILCDEKRNPYGEIMPYYGSHDTTDKLRTQITWNSDITRKIWTEIVKEKITKQKELLEKRGCKEQALLLQSYFEEVKMNDETNREGHAAKVYFNALFGMGFTRNDDSVINACLNYGYSILLSAFNREITICGYCTQLGIFHDNMFNPFNLGSDFMEPFRPIVDECVIEMNPDILGPEEKRKLMDLLNKEVLVDNKTNFLINAIRIYCNGVFNAINEDNANLLRFYK